MRNRSQRFENPKFPRREGWDLLLKDSEMKRRSAISRGTQRHMSMGMGHRLARMMKGHI